MLNNNIVAQDVMQVKGGSWGGQLIDRPILVNNSNGKFKLDQEATDPMQPVSGDVFWRMEHAGGWVTEVMASGEVRYYQVAQ